MNFIMIGLLLRHWTDSVSCILFV